jgi:RNA polymerase sigma factor (sigma-70 family)
MRNVTRGQSSAELVQQLGRLFRDGSALSLTEGELIERFARGRDEAAFEILLARHGPMVLGICRQLLRDPHDVDDAFQATFLVLVRKAGTLRRGDLLGNWLYGVALRVARRARALSARRLVQVPLDQAAVAALERSRGDQATVPEPDGPMPWLHEEVAHLPETYRVAVVLCYFEGLTHDEAAQRLGCPIGTVKGRLARARDLLLRRLSRRGVTLSAAAFAAYLAIPEARAAVPGTLELATLKASRLLAAASRGVVAPTSISRTILDLVHGASRAMTMNQLRGIALPWLVLSTVAVGLVGVALGLPQDSGTSLSGQVSSRLLGPSDATEHQGDVAKKGQQKTAIPAKKAFASGFRSQPQGIDDEAVIDGWSPETRKRFDIAELAAGLAVWDDDPKNQTILARLEEPMAMPFASPTPLGDVIKHIKSEAATADQGPLPVYVDPHGLEDAAVTPVTLDSKVTLDLEGAPLKVSLRLVLKQVGLAYCVRNGVIMISSVQGIREELAEAAVELVGTGNEEINFPLLSRMGIFRRRLQGGPGGMMMGGGFPQGALPQRPGPSQGPGAASQREANQE